MSIVISNAFKVIEGRPVTSSRIVAEYFGKQHHHVVRDIRSLIEQKPSLGKLFKSTLNNRLHRNLACVIDKSSRGAKLERAFEELP